MRLYTIIPREAWSVRDLPLLSLMAQIISDTFWEVQHGERRYAHFKRKDVPYYYSDKPQTINYADRKEKVYLQKGEPAPLKLLWDLVNERVGFDYEFCALNFYPNRDAQLDWHADDSPSIDQSRPISILSLGASRILWIRPIAHPEIEDTVEMMNGALLIMHAGMQESYEHCIKKEILPAGPRLAITFRGLK